MRVMPIAIMINPKNMAKLINGAASHANPEMRMLRIVHKPMESCFAGLSLESKYSVFATPVRIHGCLDLRRYTVRTKEKNTATGMIQVAFSVVNHKSHDRVERSRESKNLRNAQADNEITSNEDSNIEAWGI